MKKIFAIATIALMATMLILSGCSSSNSPSAQAIELSLVNFLPDVPPGNKYVHVFIDLVKQKSGGAMTIRYLGPESIPAPDAPSAAQRGTVDIASVLSPFADSMVPGISSYGRAEYDPAQIRKGPAFTYLRDTFAQNGLYYLGASYGSKPQVQTVIYLGKEISTLADLKGLKIAATGGSNKAFIDSLGAVTVPIDFTDYFTSMERGTVDGYNIGIPGIQDFSLTPVTKAMLDEPFSSNGGHYIMNMNKYNSLSQAQKDVLNSAAIQAEIDCVNVFDDIVNKVKSDISAEGVKIIHLAPADGKTFYLKYRDSMWAEDIARWPDIGPKLKGWLVDPNFPRAK